MNIVTRVVLVPGQNFLLTLQLALDSVYTFLLLIPLSFSFQASFSNPRPLQETPGIRSYFGPRLAVIRIVMVTHRDQSPPDC